MSDRFLVCKESFHGSHIYRTITVFDGETVESSAGVFSVLRDGEVVSTIGEPCGEFSNVGEARVHAGRLQRALEVMES